MKQIGDVLREMGWNRQLLDLAKRVERNVPRHSDPEAFHAEKSEIVRGLEELAQPKSEARQ